MDIIDKQILNDIQRSFPLVDQPFKLLGDNYGIKETEMISRLSRLKYENKLIRNICGIFNIEKLGFKSILVAFMIDESNLSEIANSINNISTVSHNYQRDNYYNLWFTLSLPKKTNFEDIIKAIVMENKIDKFLILPSKQVFNTEVIFNLSDNVKVKELCKHNTTANIGIIELNDLEKEVIKKLQDDLPLVNYPFADFSSQIGVKSGLFLDVAKQLLYKGIMKRYSATIRHYNAGFIYNAMVVWDVEDSKTKVLGDYLAHMPFITHCYERYRQPDWQYNLYTMMHAKSREDFESNFATLNDITTDYPYQILKSVREFKKERVKYLF